MTWYVSYVAQGYAYAHRATETFASERDAKRFARARLEAGDRALVAGTINPVLPKRVVPTAAIPDWIDET